jgi:hypothetical protein
MSTLMVEITWPDDPDRGSEHYGPFASELARDQWVEDCQEAADLGWLLLRGAHYLLTELTPPFDPTSLMQDGASSTRHKSSWQRPGVSQSPTGTWP